MIVIRKASVEDAAAISTVHVAAWKESYHGIVSDEVLNNLSIQRRMDQWVNALSDEDSIYHQVLVAEMNGLVVGFSNFGAARDVKLGFDGELFAIYILRAAHKRGIGRQLVEEAVKGLRGLGHTSMLVWVLKDNPARGFYERLGGSYLAEKNIEIGGSELLEIAYGWPDLSRFPA